MRDWEWVVRVERKGEIKMEGIGIYIFSGNS